MMARLMDKRLITKRQEQALKLCHHNFEGLTQEEAAKRMGIDRKNVSKLLDRVKKVLPKYFPIVTKEEAKVYHYYMDEGWSVEDIAEHMNLTENAVYLALQRTQNKGMYFTGPAGRILSYDKFIEDVDVNIDAFVKQKF